jgi:hypothetical protein
MSKKHKQKKKMGKSTHKFVKGVMKREKSIEKHTGKVAHTVGKRLNETAKATTSVLDSLSSPFVLIGIAGVAAFVIMKK